MLKTIVVLAVVALGLIVQNAYAHHVTQEIPVGVRPMRMSITEDLLFVSNLEVPAVSMIDTKN
ncbi:MAG: hypothetical protein QXU32_06765 [Nitrososphaerales archaeon]